MGLEPPISALTGRYVRPTTLLENEYPCQETAQVPLE